MPPDDARLEDARAWRARAELDLRAADLELGTPEAGLWGDVAFHAQQVAEKALKAFLALHDEPFRKTHLGPITCLALGRMLVNLREEGDSTRRLHPGRLPSWGAASFSEGQRTGLALNSTGWAAR
jgi:hypothetical protein